MNYKNITKEFEKNIHPELKDKIFLNFNIKKNEIIDIEFINYDYEVIETFEASFHKTLEQ